MKRKKLPRKSQWSSKKEVIVEGYFAEDLNKPSSKSAERQINPTMHPLELCLYFLAIYKIIQLLKQNIDFTGDQSFNATIQAMHIVTFSGKFL